MHSPVSIRETLTLIAPTAAAAARSPRHQAVLQFITAGDEIRKALRSQLAQDGLTVEGFQALAALQHQAGVSTPSVLAHQIGTTRALLSHTLNRLEISGLITRQRADGDRRVVRVRLTPLGKTTIEHAAATCNKSVLHLVSMFDESALAELMKSCAKLTRSAAALL